MINVVIILSICYFLIIAFAHVVSDVLEEIDEEDPFE